MFFKGIKYHFLFLICLFSVNSVKAQGGQGGKKSPQQSLPTASRSYDGLSAKQINALEAQGFVPSEKRSITSGITSPKSPQIDPKAAFRARAVAEEATYLKEVAEYNERMAQKKAFEESKRAQLAKQTQYEQEAQQRSRHGLNPTALGDEDLSGIYSNPTKVYSANIGRQRAAIDSTIQDLNKQVKDLRWVLQFLENEKSALSEDQKQALARNVAQTAEITKKLNELNQRISQLEAVGAQPSVERRADDAFYGMMNTQYPGFGQ